MSESKYPAGLVGRTVASVHVTEDKHALKLVMDDGEEIIAKCDGDCCSHTWIENLEHPEALVGSPILEAQDIEMPTPESGNSDGELAFYGFRFTTAKGACVLDYRNESNGYYGGNLSWPDDYYYGGVHGQNEYEDKWTQLAPTV